MITSGLVVQNRGYGSFPSSRTRERIKAAPYVYGFDSMTVKQTEFHNPALKTPPSVNYQKIFGKGLTATEKDFFMTHGKTMIQKAAEGVVAGRARRGKFRNKQTGASNDSFKNLLTFDEWKDFYNDHSTVMTGVDEVGADELKYRQMEKYLKEASERLKYQQFAARVLPPVSPSSVTEPSATTTPLGSIADAEEVMAMRVDPVNTETAPDEMVVDTVENEVKDLAGLFQDRVSMINGGPPPPPQPPLAAPPAPRQPRTVIQMNMKNPAITTFADELMKAIQTNKALRPASERKLSPKKQSAPSLNEQLSRQVALRRALMGEDEDDDEKEPFE